MPAHPGRFGIGFCEFVDDGADFSAVSVVEHLNGSNRPGEQERAEELIERMGYRTVGGSDAHSVSAIGACMTSFDNPIADAGRPRARAARRSIPPRPPGRDGFYLSAAILCASSL